MPDADFRSTTVAGRTFEITDVMFAGDPAESDFADAAKTDTIEQLITLVYTALPTGLTSAQMAALRMLLEVLDESGVDARAVARFTDTEKTKLGILDPVLDAGHATQSDAQFTYPTFSWL